MKPLKRWIFLCLFLSLATTIHADEGMWLPHQMEQLNLQSLGLQMDPEDLYRKDGTGLMSAVVHLGGGTGEFVSPEGLILTNHHVAFGALQRASTPEKNYIQEGFIARTREEEIPAAGYHADVLLGYEEVTEKILSAVQPSMSYREKYEAIEKAIKTLIAEAESSGQDIRATVAGMYSGNAYYLFRFKRIKDVRVVLAPPLDLGNFGGDVDNWMWPRHTCDFAFLRAYVSAENIGVDFSPDNVPYRPKSYLKISLEGFEENAFSFVMGYPGRTYRNNTLSEVEFDIRQMKKRMALYKEIISFLEKASADSPEVQIKYAGKIRGLNNSLKNYQGKVEGMAKIRLIERKKNQEAAFLEWLDQDPALKKAYGGVLQEIASYMKKYETHQSRSNLLNQMVSSYLGSSVLAQAHLIYRTAQERQRPDIEREPGFQERDLPYIRQRITLAERSYELNTDRAFLKFRIKKLVDEPWNLIPAAFQPLLARPSNAAIEEYVDALYQNTVIFDPQKRLELLENTPEELLKLNDGFLNLAAELENEMKDLREEAKALAQERLDLKKRYIEALLKMKNGRIAPDANSTIRFTYGFIRGYTPRDAVYYLPQTTLKGVIEKDTGTFPFRVPPGLKSLFARKDFGRYVDPSLGDIPVCFLNTTNVTGGNSGSPTLNARGELIGIIFDMTYESVTGDYLVIPELQRSISVDIRYVLFVTEKFLGAAHILKELNL